MAVPLVVPVLLITLIAKCQCEPTNSYYNNNARDGQFGDLLKPPPPPLLPILPVPFHGGTGKLRQNNDFGYQYQTPQPPPPPAPSISPAEFKFPAPFYKQYNFNFVPAPQPFTTTPSPSLFQKVSGWLFPSQQTSADIESQVNYNYVAPLKKDCNPCNMVPWIPVIRYDLSSDSLRQNSNHPTYGPPSPTAKTNFNSGNNVVQNFRSQSNNNVKSIQVSTGAPHTSYGPPASQTRNQFRYQSSTYGPPSPTHIINVSNQPSISSSFSEATFREIPNTSTGPGSNYQSPSTSHSLHDPIHQPSPISYTNAAFNYRNQQQQSTTYNPIPINYKPEALNQHLPMQNNVDEFSEVQPSTEFQLPKVTSPTGFRNSYGEPIVNTYHLDIPFSVSAAGAASSKIKTKVLPDSNVRNQGPNMTMALSNPAPFSLNRGRNIHTLQPVALPNLSVSPLPPIFNARPFRTVSTKYPPIFHDLNYIQSTSNNVNIEKSVPLSEYTHSIEYPTTIIQSPVIDIDELRKNNQSKAYRNIANGYEIDEIRDISPQASEDHISAAKSNQDLSFESIGISNDIYDASIPLDLQQSSKMPVNHKMSFADLRGVKDEDVDKYRTESNLQYIDSPLLYLKPSAPHKNYKNFGFLATTPSKENEYELYDEYPTTTASPQTTNSWDKSRIKDSDDLSHTTAEEENENHPKIVQIIVPYITGQRIYNDDNNKYSPKESELKNTQQEYQARKIQSNSDKNYFTIATESYSSLLTSTETPMITITDHYETERTNTPVIPNDFYDVKEPPFDIIKLQHTIDDWTQQEYSKHYGIPQKTRSNEKYAKQIPDEYFTTVNPLRNYVTESNYNFDSYDHEVSSSIQYTVTDNRTNYLPIKRKEYNVIERTKSSHQSNKNEDSESNKKLYIYTAASTFRSSTTTTPAPWGQIQTSISPLTNEKVYVVTSKPWREKNVTKAYDYEREKFNSEKTELMDDSSSLDELPFQSPRFSNRPSYGFTADASESINLDSPYGYSKGWHRRINNLEYPNSESHENISIEENPDKDEKSSITTSN